MEVDLKSILLRLLKDKWPNGIDWLTKGLPEKTADELIKIARQDNKTPEESLNLPMDLINIAEWNKEKQIEFRELFKSGDLKWLQSLLNIRKKISHSESGELEFGWIKELEGYKPYIERAKKKLKIE